MYDALKTVNQKEGIFVRKGITENERDGVEEYYVKWSLFQVDGTQQFYVSGSIKKIGDDMFDAEEFNCNCESVYESEPTVELINSDMSEALQSVISCWEEQRERE